MDVPSGVLANDFDPEGDALAAVLVNGPRPYDVIDSIPYAVHPLPPALFPYDSTPNAPPTLRGGKPAGDPASDTAAANPIRTPAIDRQAQLYDPLLHLCQR